MVDSIWVAIATLWVRSSVGQSCRLITGRSLVRVEAGPSNILWRRDDMEEKYSIFELERALCFVQGEASNTRGQLANAEGERIRIQTQVSELSIKERELQKTLYDIRKEREEEKQEIADLRILCSRITLGCTITVEDLGIRLLGFLDKFKKAREEIVRLEDRLKLVYEQWQHDSDELSRRDADRHYAEQKYARDMDY